MVKRPRLWGFSVPTGVYAPPRQPLALHKAQPLTRALRPHSQPHSEAPDIAATQEPPAQPPNAEDQPATKGPKKAAVVPKAKKAKAAGVWRREAWQEKRLKRKYGQQRKLKMSEEATALQPWLKTTEGRWQSFVDSEYEKRENVTGTEREKFDPGMHLGPCFHISECALTALTNTRHSRQHACSSWRCRPLWASRWPYAHAVRSSRLF